jgi:hypothetical protein
MLAFLLAPTLALLQDTAAPAATSTPTTTANSVLFDLWIDDLRSLPSPKDAGLVRALGMLDARLGELPLELADQMSGAPMPPAMFGLLGRMALGRKSLRVFSMPEAPMPFAVRLEMDEGSPEAAQRFADTVFSILEEMGAPLGPVGANGLAMLELPDGAPIDLGATGGAFVVDFGGAASGPGAARAGLLPSGAKPMMSMYLDVGSAVELMSAFAAELEPDAGSEMIDVFDSLGLANMSIDMAMGMDDVRSHSVVHMPGYGATMRANGMLATRMLAAEDFGIVPRDAEWAMLATMNASGTLEYLLSLVQAQLTEEGIDDPIAMLAAETGFDLRTDVVNHLGSVVAVYSSKTTGGGGMFSTVAVVELANKEGFAATLLRAKDMVDNLGATQAMGYVRVRTFTSGDDTLHSLVFPGMPIPLEVTLALGEKHLVVGLTPQAVLGALGQIRSGDGGLMANAAFTAQLPADPVGAASVQFVDSVAMASDAYGLTSLLCSALANATRSPGTSRDAGIVMPTYAEFMSGALATVTVARIEGDDYIERAHGDRSMLVNAAGMIGMFASSPIGTLFGLGIATAMISEARSSAGMAEWEAANELGYIGYVEEPTEEPVPEPEPVDEQEY